MTNRHATFLLSTLALASLAACSVGSPVDGAGTTPSATGTSSSPSATTGPPEEFVVDPVRLSQWAGNYCAAVAPLNTRLAEFDALVSASTVEDLVTTIATGLEDLATAYAEAALATTRVGIPPIEGGVEVFDTVASTMSVTREVYADMALQLAAVADDDLDAIDAVLTEARPKLRDGRKALVGVLDRPELATAFDTAPECRDALADES